MFRLKLGSLSYPQLNGFNVADQEQFAKLVVWLEDQKIRHYKIEERAGLRNTNSPNWTAELQKYLKDVSCPYDINEKNELVDWLLGLAIRLEYGDEVSKYKSVTSEEVLKTRKNVPTVVNANPLDNLDFEENDFKEGISRLAKLLNVSQHPDHLVTLKAISVLVKGKLSAEALKLAMQNPKPQGKPLSLSEKSLGFESGDYVLNTAAKVLRLLYIRDLRDLQTQINEAIVKVQNITADPKTDTRLGKVGV